MKQFTNFIEFRQAIYDQGLTRARDAQFELLDALLLSPPLRSFPELSLWPVFTRQWPSAYAAIAEGGQDEAWLEEHLIRQIPPGGRQVFALDGSAWPHPAAKTLADRQYVYSPTLAIDGGSIVVGHPYSVLAWVAAPSSSWAPAVSVQRVRSAQSAVALGVAQVKRLCRHWEAIEAAGGILIVADGK